MKRFRSAAALLLALFLAVSVTGCKSSEEIAATEQGAVVKAMLDALIAGDYATANSHVLVLDTSSDSSAGTDSAPVESGSQAASAAAFSESIPKIMFDGLTYSFTDIRAANDAYAVVTVKLKVYDHMEAFQNWFEDFAMLSLMNSSVEEPMTDEEFNKATMERLEIQLKETHCSKRTVTSVLEVQKTDDGWKVIYSDALMDNVTGGFATALKGITQQIQDMAKDEAGQS